MNLKRAFPLILLLCLIYFLNILGRIIFSPMMPLICSEMHLGHMQAGNLFFIISAGFGITLFSSQFVSTRISHKSTIILSAMSMGLSLIYTSYANSFHALRIGVFFIGLTSGLFLPSSVAVITGTLNRQSWGKTFGIFSMSQSAAFITAPLVFQCMIFFFTWHNLLALLGWIILCVGFLMILHFEGGEFHGEPITVSFIKEMTVRPAFWVTLFLLCLVTGLNMGIYSMAPDYFLEKSLLQPSQVYSLIAFSRLLGMIAAVIGGGLADSIGLKKAIPIGLLLCGIITSSMGLLPPTIALLLFCVQTPLAILLTPMVHLSISQLVPPGKNAAIVSLISSLGFLFGGGVVPQILGFFGDLKIYEWGFISFGCVTLLSGFLFYQPILHRYLEVVKENP